jgi:hypothetical protein
MLTKDKLFEIKCTLQLHPVALSGSINCYFPEDGFEILKKNISVEDSFAFENPESIIKLKLTPEEKKELL